MRRSNPIAQGRAARNLDAYWDAVVAAAPADAIPPETIDRTDAATIRRLHAQATTPLPQPAFGDQLLANLLAAIPDTGKPLPAALPVTPAAPAAQTTAPWPVPTPSRQSPRPSWTRRHPLLDLAAIFVIGVVAGLGWLAIDSRFLDDDPSRLSFDGIEANLEWQVGATAGFSDNICDVAVSNQGLVYVVDCKANDIKVFDASGALIDTWGSYGLDPGQFRFATPNGNLGGIDLDADGNIFVFDTGNNRIQKFSPDHEFLQEWGTRGDGISEFINPVGAVDRERGRVYVADTGNNRIQVFDLDGQYLDKWGERGDLNGQFLAPSAIAIGGDGTVYVADSMAQRIQHFDMTGVYIEEIGQPGQIGSVSDIAVYPDGYLVAASPDKGQLVLFATDGTYVDAVLAIEGGGTLTSPQQLALDTEGKLYILESAGILHDRPGMAEPATAFATRVIKVDLPDRDAP